MPAAVTMTFFFRPLKYKFPSGVERAKVARAKPTRILAVPRNREFLAALPISRGDIFSAHQNFAILIQFHFAALEHFSDRARPDAKRVIHADQRSCLRQSVALNRGESDAAPELLHVQVRASRRRK